LALTAETTFQRLRLKHCPNVLALMRYLTLLRTWQFQAPPPPAVNGAKIHLAHPCQHPCPGMGILTHFPFDELRKCAHREDLQLVYLANMNAFTRHHSMAIDNKAIVSVMEHVNYIQL
jgi:hypothetical protein